MQNRLQSVLDVDNSVTTTYLYDPDGIRVKKSVGSEDHYYPNRYYEMHNGAKRKYYYMGDMLIAVRESPGEFTYIHADHLGSTVGTTKDKRQRDLHLPCVRRSRSGTSPTTERQYTGQKQDDNQLMYYKPGYYDKYLGAFISPDTIIPDPTDVASYNRYAYANGNPIKYSDPSGYDPLDTDWQASVGAVNSDEVLKRLYSIAFPDEYAQIDFSTTTIEKVLENAYISTSWDDVPASLIRLSTHYDAGEEALFARDVGTLYGGLKNRLEEPSTWAAISYENNPARKWLYVSPGQFSSALTGKDPDANIHHWAWSVAIGGSWMQPAGELLNSVREYSQLAPHQRISPGDNFYSDIIMGNAGVGFGRHMLMYGLTDIEGVFNGSISSVQTQVDYLRSWFK